MVPERRQTPDPALTPGYSFRGLHWGSLAKQALGVLYQGHGKQGGPASHSTGKLPASGGRAVGGNLRPGPLTQDLLPPQSATLAVCSEPLSKPRHFSDSVLVGLKPKLGQVKKACPTSFCRSADSEQQLPSLRLLQDPAGLRT